MKNLWKEMILFLTAGIFFMFMSITSQDSARINSSYLIGVYLGWIGLLVCLTITILLSLNHKYKLDLFE